MAVKIENVRTLKRGCHEALDPISDVMGEVPKLLYPPLWFPVISNSPFITEFAFKVLKMTGSRAT
jgi:hypothetical protein